MRQLFTWFLILSVLVGGGYALKITAFAPKPVPVQLRRVEKGLVERTVTNSRAGTVKSRLRSRISPEVPGRIVEIPHREGESVKKGDVLIRLDPRTAAAALTLAQRQVEAAVAVLDEVGARLDQVARELERESKLLEKEASAEKIVDDLKSQRRVFLAARTAGEARAAAARAEVERVEVEVAKTVVTAPFPGVVTEVFGEVGELAAPVTSGSDLGFSATPTLEIVNLDELFVRAEIDEVDMGELQEGLPVRITLDPFPDRSFQGRVSRVAPVVSDIQEKNRTVEIEVEFVDPEESRSLLPGTSADVEVILVTHDSVLRIPAHAVLEGDKVLLLQGDHLQERTLKIGLRNWDFVEVLSGLALGDPIVVSLDREEIREGALAVEESEE